MGLSEPLIFSQVLYNNKGYHSMPTYLNSLNNAILRANLPKSKGNPAAYGELGRQDPGGLGEKGRCRSSL